MRDIKSSSKWFKKVDEATSSTSRFSIEFPYLRVPTSPITLPSPLHKPRPQGAQSESCGAGKNGNGSTENGETTNWLVVGPPLWKIWESIGMIIPNIWENRIDVPNHQKSSKIVGQTSKNGWLVVSTPLKNMKVNWDDYSQYMGK